MGCNMSQTRLSSCAPEDNVSCTERGARSPHSVGIASTLEGEDATGEGLRGVKPAQKRRAQKNYRLRAHNDDPRDDALHMRSSSISTCVSPPRWLADPARVPAVFPARHNGLRFSSSSPEIGDQPRTSGTSRRVDRSARRSSARTWISDTMWENVSKRGSDRLRTASCGAVPTRRQYADDRDAREQDPTRMPVRFRATRAPSPVWLGFGDSTDARVSPQYSGDAETHGVRDSPVVLLR